MSEVNTSSVGNLTPKAEQAGLAPAGHVLGVKTKLFLAFCGMAALTAHGVDAHRVAALTGIEEEITAKLGELNVAVERRLAAKTRKEKAVAGLSVAHARFLEKLEPVVDDATFELVLSTERATTGNE